MRVTRSRGAAPAERKVIPIAAAAPVPNPKAYVPSDDGDGGSGPKVDYKAVIEKYKAKVTNRGSAIRAFCVECSGGALSEVRECQVKKCALYPYRMGVDPNNKKTAAKLAKQGDEEDGDE